MPWWKKLLRGLLQSLLLACMLPLAATAADEFLGPEQAFSFSTEVLDARTLRLRWDIAPGYHLYKDRISLHAEEPSPQWAPLNMPMATDEFDANFSKTMAVYRRSLQLDVHMLKSQPPPRIDVAWQGCADSGLCYAPASASIQLSLSGSGDLHKLMAQITPEPPTEVAAQSAAAPVRATAPATMDTISASLASGNLLQTLGVFWLAGLLLSLTPCVLPMLPILSSLIAGQTGPVGRARGFALALAYSLGMAMVYAGFGVAAGLAGEGLAAALQNPWVLGGFAMLLCVLAMSMFGFYELQLPGGLQSRAAQWSNRFRGGSTIGVFLMGGVSALVIGPCVAAPLAGALVYISQTRDMLLGGAALFSMALGMGVPLLLLGLSAGSLLPRVGAWMEGVKKLFGMLLLGVAIWMLSPMLAGSLHMLLWSAWLLCAAAMLGIFGAATAQQARAPVAARACGAALSALATVLLVGAASGGQSVLQPLAHLRAERPGSNATRGRGDGLQFERIASVQALEAALAQARQKRQPVMLDFYADWCVACKEMESFTFSDPQVQKRLAPVRLLQADVTANSVQDKELLKRFSLFGPPGIIFFDGSSDTRASHTVIGYQAPAGFLASISSAAIP